MGRISGFWSWIVAKKKKRKIAKFEVLPGCRMGEGVPNKIFSGTRALVKSIIISLRVAFQSVRIIAYLHTGMEVMKMRTPMSKAAVSFIFPLIIEMRADTCKKRYQLTRNVHSSMFNPSPGLTIIWMQKKYIYRANKAKNPRISDRTDSAVYFPRGIHKLNRKEIMND